MRAHVSPGHGTAVSAHADLPGVTGAAVEPVRRADPIGTGRSAGEARRPAGSTPSSWRGSARSSRRALFHGEGGYRKIRARLANQGLTVSGKRVLRLMRRHGLLAPRRLGPANGDPRTRTRSSPIGRT